MLVKPFQPGLRSSANLVSPNARSIRPSSRSKDPGKGVTPGDTFVDRTDVVLDSSFTIGETTDRKPRVKPSPTTSEPVPVQSVPVTLLAAHPSISEEISETDTAEPLIKDFAGSDELTEGGKLRLVASHSYIQDTLPHQNRSRAPWTYAFMLGSGFGKFIAERCESPRPWNWLDAGSGESSVPASVLARGAAGLIKPKYSSGKFSYQKGEPANNLSVTLVDLATPIQSDSRTKVLNGRKIENIPSDEIGQHDLLTDIQGPIAYSNRPDLVLGKYLDALKDDGKLFLSLGSDQDRSRAPFGETNSIVGKDGVARNYVQWMQSIPGLKVKVHHIAGASVTSKIRAIAVEIQKEPGQFAKIPELEEVPVFLEPGGPPRMLLRERIDADIGETRAVQDARQATRRAMQEVTLKETGPEIIEKFKGGLLRSALRKVPDGKWAHLSKINSQVEATIGSSQESERLELGGLFGSHSPIGSVVENPSDLEPNRSLQLISDDGPLSWSFRPDLTLNSYLDALHDDGEILVNLGDEARGQGLRSTVFTQAGEEFRLANWLRRANGLQVKIHEKWGDRPEEDMRFAQIRIKDRHEIEVPELQILAVTTAIDDGTQSVILQEKCDYEPKISMLHQVGRGLANFWDKYLS